jgi:hypothetical protein
VATPYQLNGSGMCVEVEPAELYHPGERVDLSVLPNLETLIVGTGKARALFSGFGSIPYLPGWNMDGGGWVNESGGMCTPFESPDGTLRCVLPSAVRATHSTFLYDDAACSEAPVVPWFTLLCQGDPPLPSVVMLLNETVECPEIFPFSEAFAVAGESTASTHYAKDETTGACAPVDPVVTGARYLRLGEALSPTAFPEIERALRE